MLHFTPSLLLVLICSLDQDWICQWRSRLSAPWMLIFHSADAQTRQLLSWWTHTHACMHARTHTREPVIWAQASHPHLQTSEYFCKLGHRLKERLCCMNHHHADRGVCFGKRIAQHDGMLRHGSSTLQITQPKVVNKPCGWPKYKCCVPGCISPLPPFAGHSLTGFCISNSSLVQSDILRCYFRVFVCLRKQRDSGFAWVSSRTSWVGCCRAESFGSTIPVLS